MRTKTTAMALIVTGIMLVAFTRFNFIAAEKVGASKKYAAPVEIIVEKDHPIQWSPIIRVALLVGGIVIFIRDKSAGDLTANLHHNTINTTKL
jgi:hypothetical protein